MRTISTFSVIAVVATGLSVPGAAQAAGSGDDAPAGASVQASEIAGDTSQPMTRATSARASLTVSKFRLARSGRTATGKIAWDRKLLGKKNRFTVNLMAFQAAGSTPQKITGRQYSKYSKRMQTVHFKVSAKKAAKLKSSRVLVLTATQQRGARAKGAFDRSAMASAYLRNSARQGQSTASVRSVEPRFLGVVNVVMALTAGGIELSQEAKKNSKQKKPKVVASKSRSEGTVSVGANLRAAQAAGANLTGSVVLASNLAGANLQGANLSRMNLAGSNLRGANLRGANLAGVNLRGVDLTGVDLTGANLAGADLTGAILTGVIGAVLPQYISFAPLANINLSEATTVVAATGGGSGNPVEFASATTGTCTTGGENGSTVTLVAEGTCTIEATQAGNSGYLTAPAVTRSFAIMTPESCAAGGTCEPGDVGPGGGVVFYVDYDRPAGSRVFEMAPNGWSEDGADTVAMAGCSGVVIAGTSSVALGAGQANTAAIIAGCETPGIAARIASDYASATKSDWYLPSLGEMEALCTSLYPEVVGATACVAPEGATQPSGFTVGPYQTSSLLSATYGYAQDIPPMGVVGVNPRDYESPVRPIRSF